MIIVISVSAFIICTFTRCKFTALIVLYVIYIYLHLDDEMEFSVLPATFLGYEVIVFKVSNN